MSPLKPDPQALYDAGSTTIGAAGALDGSLRALLAGLSGSGGMCGDDPSGIEVARAYNDAAKALVVALVDTVNGCARIGDGCKASAANYANANHASSLGPSSATPLQFPTPTEPKSAKIPPSAEGGQGLPGWQKAVEMLVHMVVPNGDPAKMQAAAGYWRQMAEACHNASAALAGPKNTAAEQVIPEEDKITTAFSTSITSLDTAAVQCSTVAGKLDAYARHVKDVQDKVHDLLATLGDPEKIAEGAWQWLSGHGFDKLRALANDVRAILENLQTEAHDLAHLLAPLVAEAEAFGEKMLGYAQMAVQEVEDFAHNTAAAVVNTAAAWAYAGLTHPGDVLLVAGGLMLADAGAGGEVAGIALDATGIGAVAGVPANVISAGAIATGATAAGAGLAEIGQAADKHDITVMEYRGQPRNDNGTFAGGKNYGKEAEAEGIKNYQDDTGRQVITDKHAIKVTNADGETVNAFPDALARKPDGTYEAVEVKSGEASLTPNQRALRDEIKAKGYVEATVVEDGEVKTVKVTSFHVEKVASEGPGH